MWDQNVLDETVGWNYLREMVERICEAERQATASLIKIVDSVPYFVYAGGGNFPYITHRLGEETYIQQHTDYISVHAQIVGRFVCGHAIKGYKGTQELTTYMYEPLISHALSRNQWLTFDMPVTLPGETTPRVWKQSIREFASEGITFERTTGTRWFDNSGLGLGPDGFPNQVGYEYACSADFHIEQRKRY
jgi:hypothetical protein